MGSLDNFHQAIMQRVQAGELELGVSRMAGAEPGSIAFSRFWTLFPFMAVAGYIGIPWYLDSDLFWGIRHICARRVRHWCSSPPQ